MGDLLVNVVIVVPMVIRLDHGHHGHAITIMIVIALVGAPVRDASQYKTTCF